MASTLSRKTVVTKGYDCIAKPCGQNGCVEGRPRHGRCADEWEFTVTDGQIAFSARVTSDELAGVYKHELRIYDPERPLVEILTHTSFPRAEHEEHVRMALEPETCTYVDGGKCYPSYNGIGWARELFAKHGGRASRTPAPAPGGVTFGFDALFAHDVLPEQPESLWKALEVLHMEESAKLRTDSIAHLAQCPACQGRGVIEGK